METTGQKYRPGIVTLKTADPRWEVKINVNGSLEKPVSGLRQLPEVAEKIEEKVKKFGAEPKDLEINFVEKAQTPTIPIIEE